MDTYTKRTNFEKTQIIILFSLNFAKSNSNKKINELIYLL